MMNVLEYKGYHARVELDPEDECLVGRLVGINDIVGFHGETIAEIKTAFHEAVDDYVETCRKTGKTPERSFSGKVMFRIAPEVHARAALAAQLKGMSLNQWAETVLAQAVSQDAGDAPNAKQTPAPGIKATTRGTGKRLLDLS
jgi:predicted HicB family RNase H-like nuclease